MISEGRLLQKTQSGSCDLQDGLDYVCALVSVHVQTIAAHARHGNHTSAAHFTHPGPGEEKALVATVKQIRKTQRTPTRIIITRRKTLF